MVKNVNKTRWLMIKDLVANIQEAGGTIFGGAVRDSIIHDHYAELFYADCEIKDRFRYNDALFKPETRLRLLIPNDIDCFLNDSQLDILKTKLTKQLYAVTESHRDRPAHIYFPDIPDPIKHTKWSISFAVNPLLDKLVEKNNYTISLDILHTNDTNVVPPFGTIDFECNAVILTSDNDYKLADIIGKGLTAKGKLTEMNRIVEDIKKMRTTVIYNNLHKYRLDSMILKIWSIKTSCMTLNHEIAKDELCLICLEDFKSKANIKFNCCNGRMHYKKCAHKFLNSDCRNKCPMCRKYIYVQNDDIKLVE